MTCIISITVCANRNNRPICRKTYTPTAIITSCLTINIRTTLNPTCAIPCIHSYMTPVTTAS